MTPRRIFTPLQPLASPWDAVAAECPDGLTARDHERVVDGCGVAHVVWQGETVPRCLPARLKPGTAWRLVPIGGLAIGERISDAQTSAELHGRSK